MGWLLAPSRGGNACCFWREWQKGLERCTPTQKGTAEGARGCTPTQDGVAVEAREVQTHTGGSSKRG